MLHRYAKPEGAAMETTDCPDCGVIAEVEWRTVMESTDGPIEHAKIRCLNRHWFQLPVASLGLAVRAGPRTDASRAQARVVPARP